MRDVYVIGVHTTKFGKCFEKTHKEFAAETVDGCLKDAQIGKEDLQALWFSNSSWGQREFQICIRGQVALREYGIDGIPITNVENACAGGSTAFHNAWMGVASELYDVTMAVGVEKIYHLNKTAMFAGFLGGVDVSRIKEDLEKLKDFAPNSDSFKGDGSSKSGKGNLSDKKSSLFGQIQKSIGDLRDKAVTAIDLGEKLGYDTIMKLASAGIKGRTPFMDMYSYIARKHMEKYGSTQNQLAVIASKNHFHSSLNPNAHYNFVMSPDEVLSDRVVSWPLTRAMCAPISDGASSAILVSEKFVKKFNLQEKAVKVRASVLASGREKEKENETITGRASRKAFEIASLGPEDIQIAEVHDATAFGELYQSEQLGFCKEGEGGLYAESGATKLGGARPINTSGGLESRGHPIGASGLAQIHELVVQLQRRCGKRQAPGVKIALAQNGGGAIGNEEAAMCIHVLEKCPV